MLYFYIAIEIEGATSCHTTCVLASTPSQVSLSASISYSSAGHTEDNTSLTHICTAETTGRHMHIQHVDFHTDSTSVTTTCTTATMSPIGIVNFIANIATYVATVYWQILM